MRRRPREISAEFADILERRALMPRHVVPKAARRELSCDHAGAAVHQRGAHGHNAADAVVHRQAVVMSVRFVKPRQPREPVRPGDDLAMAHLRRLGQAGRAGGEDAQGPVVQRHRGRVLLVQRRGGIKRQRHVEPPLAAIIGPHLARKPCVAQFGRAFRRRNGDFRFRRVQGVRERRAFQVRRDQRDNGADPRQPQPDGDIFRPVSHHQRHRGALGDALRQRPARILVQPHRQPGETVALLHADQRRAVAMALRPFGDGVRQRAGRVAGGVRQGLQRARPGGLRLQQGGAVQENIPKRLRRCTSAEVSSPRTTPSAAPITITCVA